MTLLNVRAGPQTHDVGLFFQVFDTSSRILLKKFFSPKSFDFGIQKTVMLPALSSEIFFDVTKQNDRQQ